jgi:poly-gamma-glutamate capsule biosynthesis protein CapA/YwtB (metallophosphatase superfamily)
MVQPLTPRPRYKRPVLRWAAALLVVALTAIACDSGNAQQPPNGATARASGQAGGGSVIGAKSPTTPPATPGASGASVSATDGSAGTGTNSVTSPTSTGTNPGTATQPPAAPSTGPTPLAVVTGFDNYKLNSITTAALVARLKAKTALVPCGAEAAIAAALKTTSSGWAACIAPQKITASLPPASTKVGLLPPGLVGPGVKVVPLGGVDLFGEAPDRAGTYPLIVTSPGWSSAWTTYDTNNVRVILTTGVNCADRGVSRQTNTFHKGWEWLLNAGTARYTGTHFDGRLGWNVVDAVRTGNLGAIKKLIKNADIATSDFECAMAHNFVQHDNGTQFSVDPKVAPLMKEAGFDVATIGSDHMTNWGFTGLFDTIKYFDQNGIKHVGAGSNLAAALKPAVINVRGIRFAFYALNAAGGSAPAGTNSAGTATLNAANIARATDLARSQADVVIAMPQWSTSEYRAAFLDTQIAWRNEMYAAGTDQIIGADFHWAGAISITPGGVSGNHFATASVGNFWFGQDWSRQTEEGYMTLLTFVGTRLAQVRLIPTVVLDNAQPNLTNPATDGQFVLKQALGPSTIKPKNPS